MLKYVDMRTKAIAICMALDPSATWAQTDRVQQMLEQLRKDALDNAIEAVEEICDAVGDLKSPEWREGTEAATAAIRNAQRESLAPR